MDDTVLRHTLRITDKRMMTLVEIRHVTELDLNVPSRTVAFIDEHGTKRLLNWTRSNGFEAVEEPATATIPAPITPARVGGPHTRNLERAAHCAAST